MPIDREQIDTILAAAIASGDFIRTGSYTISTADGTRTMNYRSIKELRELMEFLSFCGKPSYIGRTRAGAAR